MKIAVVKHWSKSLVRGLVFCVVVDALSGFAATYSYDDSGAAQRKLYVDVADGATETLDTTWMEPYGATVTEIIKLGDGTLIIPQNTSLASTAFDISVQDGIFRFGGKPSLGNIARTITVNNGATLWNTSGGDYASIGAGVTTHFSGEGHKGMGALYKNNYSYGYPFGYWVLEGDAKVWTIDQYENDPPKRIDMNGHALDLHVQASYWEYVVVTNAGAIRIHGNPNTNSNFVRFKNWNALGGGSEETLSFENTAWQLQDMRRYLITDTGLNRSLSFGAGASIHLLTGSYSLGFGNYWAGPVEVLNDTLPLTVAADKGELSFAFTNVVSGGGFELNGLNTTTLGLYLSNSGNSYTNGITGRYAKLHLGANGALPATGGALALTNSAVILEDSSAIWSLPAAEFAGTGSVKGGRGAWASFTKTGAGNLFYDSVVGSDTLDITEGTVDFRSFSSNRTVFAGLVEGIQHVNFGSASAQRYEVYAFPYLWRYNASSNSITRGARLLYDSTLDPETGWTTNLFLSYTGYIWNNSPTNELWAFAGHGTDSESWWRLNIDGKKTVGFTRWNNQNTISYCGDGSAYWDLHTNAVVLAPGPHRFEYRHAVPISAKKGYGVTYSYGIGDWGTYKSTLPAKYEKWGADRGLMYSRKGVCTRNIDDYEMLVDPGDGSLLTWDIPLPDFSPAPHPITGELVSPLPTFDKLRMAPGTEMLVPAGSTWAFTEVEGLPTVIGGNVSVAGAWTVCGSDAGSTPFTITGTLTFGPGAHFVPPAQNERPADRSIGAVYVLGTADGGIVNHPAEAVGPRWRVFVEGNAVKAAYLPLATIITVK